MKEEKRIYLGLNREEKPERIRAYISNHPEVKEIVYFYPVGLNPLDLSEFRMPVEYRTYWDVVRYVFNIPLLEKVNPSVLIIYDEMMRTVKRTDISYNACHHVANQTNAIMCFQYFPVIESKEDFMILVDFCYPWKYKMFKFNMIDISDFCAEIKPHHIVLDKQVVETSDEQKQCYQTITEKMFEQIGNGDPNVIPRRLEKWCGDLKKDSIADNDYIARDGRFKKDNVHAYKEYRLYDGNTNLSGSGPSKHLGKIINGYKSKEFTIIDFPMYTAQFIDFLQMSEAEKLIFLSTGFSVDEMYYGIYKDILNEMEDVWNET